MTKNEAIGEIAAKFSGRLAEELFVGADRASLSTEADLQHATLLAKDLAMKYGGIFGYVWRTCNLQHTMMYVENEVCAFDPNQQVPTRRCDV